jgi:hypothetical protein
VNNFQKDLVSGKSWGTEGWPPYCERVEQMCNQLQTQEMIKAKEDQEKLG